MQLIRWTASNGRRVRAAWSVVVVALPLLLFGVAAACGGRAAPTAPSLPGDGKGSVVTTWGLEQGVTVSPAAPAHGGTITVRSVITNRGATTVTLTSRMCGLSYGGTLAVTDPPGTMRCMAISRTDLLAPGDSIVATDVKRVTSLPGRYVLRVVHAMEPAMSVDVPIAVGGSAP